LLGLTGFTAAEVSEGGKAHDRWPGIADALLEGARRRITIERQNREDRDCT
jgi:hypothetical protein